MRKFPLRATDEKPSQSLAVHQFPRPKALAIGARVVDPHAPDTNLKDFITAPSHHCGCGVKKIEGTPLRPVTKNPRRTGDIVCLLPNDVVAEAEALTKDGAS